jgi:hypothetical protein
MCNFKSLGNYIGDISLEQIDDFIININKHPIDKLKVLGGEPLMHPQFVEIFNKLALCKNIGMLKVDTNHILPRPLNLVGAKNLRWMGKKQKHKRHYKFLYDPSDYGIKVKVGGCQQLYKCGMSLSSKGYLPCSQAIAITYLLDLEHLYKKDFPLEPWGLEDICPHCPENMSNEWKAQWTSRELNSFTKEELLPSPTFLKALINKGVKF